MSECNTLQKRSTSRIQVTKLPRQVPRLAKNQVCWGNWLRVASTAPISGHQTSTRCWVFVPMSGCHPSFPKRLSSKVYKQMKTIIDDIGEFMWEKRAGTKRLMTYSVMWVLLWRKGLGTGFSHSQNCWLVPKVKRLTTYVLMPDGSQFSLSGCTLHQANEELYVFLCHFVHKLGAQVTHYCVSAQNEHVAPGAQAKYTSSTNQLQLQRQNPSAPLTFTRRVCTFAFTKASRDLALMYPCFLFSELFSYNFILRPYDLHMFTLLFITSPSPHLLQERSKKYTPWVGGGSSGPNPTFQQCKKVLSMLHVHVFKNCFLVPSVSITCLPWVEGIIPKKLHKWFSFLKQILLTSTNNI